jgi:hypothetical protein
VGRFNAGTRRVEEHERAEPGDEDLLNLAAIYTLAHGNAVYPIESSQIPDGSLVARGVSPAASQAWQTAPKRKPPLTLNTRRIEP